MLKQHTAFCLKKIYHENFTGFAGHIFSNMADS
jgi:hypothetical protein